MASFILASQSPRRKSLLEWAEIKFEIVVSDTDESYPANLPIADVPEYIAKHKAIAVEQKIKDQGNYHQDICIIAADTVVVLANEIIGKPLTQIEQFILLMLFNKSDSYLLVYIDNEFETVNPW